MIRLGHVPELGKILIVENGEWIDRSIVQRAFAATSVLEHQAEPASRSWILDVLRCVERLPQDEFVLADIYMSEAELQSWHPDNRNVRAKIRQQLQVLRDHGVIAFTSRGSYRRVASGRTPDAAHHAREQERSKGLPRKRHSASRLPRGEA